MVANRKMKNRKRKKKISQYKPKQKKVELLKQISLENEKSNQVEQVTLYKNLVKIISKPTKLVHFFIAIFATVSGFVLNAFNEMPMFWLKGLFGFGLYILLTSTIIYIKDKNKEIVFELTGDPNLTKCRTNYTKRISSNYNFLLCFVACIYFVAVSLILGFVKINLIGIYSLLALSCVVFFAFIIFQYYISVLILLRDISKIHPENYYELIPERTEWFHLLETFSNTCRNIFIILGMLFILLFIIFSPVNSIQIIFQEKFSSFMFLHYLVHG